MSKDIVRRIRDPEQPIITTYVRKTFQSNCSRGCSLRYTITRWDKFNRSSRLAYHGEMTLIATMVYRMISLFYSGGFWITNLWRKESNSYHQLQVCRAKSAVLTALRSEVNIGIWNLLTIAWRIVWRKHFFGTEIHGKWNFLDFDTPLPVFVFIIRFVYIFISSS